MIGPKPVPSMPPSRKIRRVLRLAGGNALLLVAGLALAALAGETYFRLAAPFTSPNDWPRDLYFRLTSLSKWPPNEFVPGVGYVRKPDIEFLHTNRLNVWNVSRTNRLGFFDRDPLSPERAAASCHVAMLGASFVEALEVPIEEKLHVRLEALAARALPHVDVTASAFGVGGTGQAQHLAFYDAYVRPLRPRLLVLVFSPNDFPRNSPILEALTRRWDPERMPHHSIERRPDGKMTLRPPHPDFAEFRPPRLPGPERWAARALEAASAFSWFAGWLEARTRASRLFRPDPGPELVMRVEQLSRRPRYAKLLEGLEPAMLQNMQRTLASRNPPPVFLEALAYTAFALEQFKERADRDGAELIILAVHRHRTSAHGVRLLHRLSAMAGRLSIPVIDQGAYILRQGAAVEDAQWPHDGHWNAAGHRWAAEALLEHLERRLEICRRSE